MPPLRAHPRRKSLCAALVLAAAASLSPAALAQCETFGPRAPGFRASQSVFYDQIWSQIARTSTGYVAVWSEGQNISLRRFDANLAPLGNDTLVNATLSLDIQDEPAVAVATGGNQLIAWSDRHGYDGEQMGIYGRVYNAAGTPLATEFRINQITTASQWRPLIAPTPAGGFVVAWSGNWDGDAYMRILSSTGAALSNDIRINQYLIDAQVDPSVAVASNGNIFAVFVDFSSGTSVDGLDLYGRLFNASGAPLTNEFLITTPAFTTGHQALPRVAVDGQNRFLVVWQSELGDGSSTCVVGRRFDVNATPISGEFIANSTTASAQLEARVAAQSNGDFVVTFEDYSTGTARVMYRRFDANLNPKGPDEPIDAAQSATYRPELIVDPTGADVVFAYESWGNGDGDVYLRRYQSSAGAQVFCTGKLNSQGCTPAIAFNGSASATSPSAFTISAANVINQSPGLLFYGYSSAFIPFQGGTLCLNDFKRTPIQFSGGSAVVTNCSGTLSYDFNARIQGGTDPLLVPGAVISAQYYFRDVNDPAGFGTGLSNALRFTICP
ncbi:MAG: hypothetical protein JNL28_15950 [Planctomycetes bacterium]|nr:hypothetical protein [Planctomycetota bacterium]